MSDFRALLIEQLEHERHREEQRAEGYLLLLGLTLDQLQEARQQLRLAGERHIRLIEEHRVLIAQTVGAPRQAARAQQRQQQEIVQ